MGETVLFDRFTVFKNKYGEFEIANENEMVMTNRYTGEMSKCNIEDFCNTIKLLFPDKEEQKALLIEMFRD